GRKQRGSRLKEQQGFGGNFVSKFRGVLSIVAADADSLRRLDGVNEGSFGERKVVHAAAGQAFEVAIAQMRRVRKDSGDFVASGDGFDEAVLDGAIERKPTITHAI